MQDSHCIIMACSILGVDRLPESLDERLREINVLAESYEDGQLYSRQVIAHIIWQWQQEQKERKFKEE